MAYSQVTALASRVGIPVYALASTVVYVSNDDITPGQYWKAYRQSKGWGLRSVARRAGVVHGTVSNFENRIGGYESMESGTIAALARGYGQTEAIFRASLKGAYVSPEGGGFGSPSTRQDAHHVPVRTTVSAGTDQPDYLNGVYVYIGEDTLIEHGTSREHVDVYLADGSCVYSEEATNVEKPVKSGDRFAVDKRSPPTVGAVVACWWPKHNVIALLRHGLDGSNVRLRSFDPEFPTLVLPKLADVTIIGRVFWRAG